MAVRIVTIVVVAFLGIGAVLPSRGFFVVLPSAGAFPAVPVSIRGPSGIVSGLSIGSNDGPPGPIVAVPGRPDSIEYSWLGGRCDRSVTIQVERDGPSIDILRRTVETGSTCLLDGIRRSVVIEFYEAVDPSRVVDSSDLMYALNRH